MQGEVIAQNAGVGAGSAFSVIFPLAEAPESASEPESDKEYRFGATQPQSKKVLVVDDEPDIVASMAALLRALGFSAISAGNDAEALALVRREKPEVVLMDIGMPGMGGYELARTMRERGLVKSQLIAVTGYGQQDDIERAKRAGFDHHFTKPVGMRELLQVIVD